MYLFFREGGWSMYPVLVVGLILLWSAIRYAIDREPARRPFLAILTLTYSVIIAEGLITAVATVFWALSTDKFPAEERVTILLMGLKESSRPAVLGLGFMGLALMFVCIAIYRTSLRELRAAHA